MRCLRVLGVLGVVLATAVAACIDVKINYVDPMTETDSEESSGSDDATSSDDDPSTSTTDPTDPSTTEPGTTTDPTTSTSTTGPVDPCAACLQENCAAELAACVADEDCACVLDCLESGGGFMQCPADCGVVGFPPALTSLGFCAATACMGECQFP